MGRPKKAPQDKYIPTDSEQKAMVWCINNMKKVYPVPVGNEYKIVYEYVEQGRIKKVESLKTYPKDNYCSTIWRIYEHEYKKYKEKNK